MYVIAAEFQKCDTICNATYVYMVQIKTHALRDLLSTDFYFILIALLIPAEWRNSIGCSQTPWLGGAV